MSEIAKEAIRSKINLFIKTNGNEKITAPQVNEILQDVLDSYPNKITDAAMLGLGQYSTTRSYLAGLGCFFNGRLYKAKVNTTPGGFDITQWDDVFATAISEVTINFTDTWTTQTLPNVRKLNFNVDASDATIKTILLNPTPMEGDEVNLKDVKRDSTAFPWIIDGNGKNTEDDTSIQLNSSGSCLSLKYDGLNTWNII